MKALILVDLQNDFMTGGALAVKGSLEILPAINTLLKYPFDLRIASKDWHPLDHASFAINQGKNIGEQIILNGLNQILWPVHCVQGSSGAEFCPGWDSAKIDQIIYKGIDREIDSYSVFFDNGHLRSTQLDAFLKAHKITDLFIAGLATDFCVKFSTLDALQLGYTTYVVTDGCRAVNLQPAGSQQALDEMQQHGAILTTTAEIRI